MLLDRSPIDRCIKMDHCTVFLYNAPISAFRCATSAVWALFSWLQAVNGGVRLLLGSHENRFQSSEIIWLLQRRNNPWRMVARHEFSNSSETLRRASAFSPVWHEASCCHFVVGRIPDGQISFPCRAAEAVAPVSTAGVRHLRGEPTLLRQKQPGLGLTPSERAFLSVDSALMSPLATVAS